VGGGKGNSVYGGGSRPDKGCCAGERVACGCAEEDRAGVKACQGRSPRRRNEKPALRKGGLRGAALGGTKKKKKRKEKKRN